MNKKEIFKKIGGIITEITEQYQYLSQDTENINELELELFMANSHFLAEHLVILQKLNFNSPKILTPTVEVIKSEEIDSHHSVEHVEAVVLIPYNEPTPVSTLENDEPSKKFDQVFEFENKPIEQLYNRQLSAEEIEILDQKKAEQAAPLLKIEEIAEAIPITHEAMPAPIELPKQENQHFQSVDNEQKTPPVLTINDILSGKNSQSANVASQLNQQQSVKDVKSIISLNDKLLFIKDLFNGYSLAYSEAIDLVNRSNSFEAAEHFLNANYALKNGWSQKQTTVDKLHEIISRKFAK